MNVTWAVGQRLTAAALQDAFDFITPQTYVKPAMESRNSGGTGTTYTIDTDLQGITLEVGQYEIELVGFFTLANTTPKIKTQWRFTGTWNSPVRACSGPSSGNTAAPNVITEATFEGFVADTQDAVYGTSTAASYTIFREVARNVTVTAAGSLALYWAQNASSASNTNLQGGTSFTVRRIS